MSKKITTLSLFLVLLTSNNTLFAREEIVAVDSVVSLREVMVTSTKEETGILNTPLTMSVIDKDELEERREPAVLQTLSKRVPGLFVTQKGLFGYGLSTDAAGAVSIRGVGGGNKVLMMTDGLPQWAGIFGHALPDTYLADHAQRVEIIRGPASLIYGSNAMGGVINVISNRQEKDGMTAGASSMFGSYNTVQTSAQYGFREEGVDALLVTGNNRTDGYRRNSTFDQWNIMGNVGYELSENWNARAQVSYVKSTFSNPGAITAPLEDNDMRIQRGIASLLLENQYKNLNGAFKFYYNWGDHTIDDGYKIAMKRTSDSLFISDDHNWGAMAYQSLSLIEGNTLTAGADFKNWGGKAWYEFPKGMKGDIPLVDKNVNELAGFLIDKQALWNRFFLTAGIRWEYNQTYGSEWVPQGGFAWHAFDGTVFKGNVSKGFRSPNLRELYMFPPKNPDLQPERMVSYELSWDQTLVPEVLESEVSLYYIDGENMIQVQFPGGKPRNVNTGAFHNKGVEAQLNYMPLRDTRIFANYAYLHSNVNLISAPTHQANMGITQRFNDFTFSVDAQYVGDLMLNATSGLKESYFLADARASYRYGKSITLFLKVNNITNSNYTVMEGFPMPGTTVIGGLSVSIDQ
ncbi:MAG: TonB-dependent receptor [Bacteroidales bacterium]|nr:TonB-dependent receptor [Bacteroidales bacterium]MDD4821754.1 TonB-dependent receptor [Bacteroidales bacterium]